MDLANEPSPRKASAVANTRNRGYVSLAQRSMERSEMIRCRTGTAQTQACCGPRLSSAPRHAGVAMAARTYQARCTASGTRVRDF
jgi:hypothetical protein